MAGADVKMGAPDPVASSVHDDDDLIDYDDEELEPVQVHVSTKLEEPDPQPNDANNRQESPETVAINSVSFTKLTDFDRSLSIPSETPVPAYKQTAVDNVANDMDEINYDTEDNTADDVNGLSAPTEHKGREELAQAQNEDQDDEEIDFGITDDIVTAQHNPASDGDGEQKTAATIKTEQILAAPTQTGNAEELQGQIGADDEGLAPVDVDAAKPQADNPSNLSKTSQADAAEIDEITWEDHEEQIVPGDNAHHADQPAPGSADVAESTSPQDAAQPFVAGEQVELGDHVYEETENTDEEFPAVTVQYKGEEFPLFSITSEGFFTSTSVLHENIGSLLAGFREELANEIASEDELVFQVDELGLEFAESHSQDTLGNVTLNQILEIFDLLVKNQDPDSDRVLYAYLMTKPSTTKRFESLIESAAAGTGLDRVIYHFDSPVPLRTNPDREYLESSHHDLDEYQSQGDASAEPQGQDTNDQAEYDYIDDLDDNTQVNANGPNINQGEQYGEGEQGELQAQVESLPQTVEENLAAALAQPEDNAGANALAEGDVEMAMEPDLDNTGEDGGFDVNGDLTDEYQNDGLDLANGGTSASNTIDNEDSVNMTAEEAAEALDQYDETKTPDQAEDEIDWREEPGDDDISTMSAGATKRSHDTVGLNQEDGPEPKRQRS